MNKCISMIFSHFYFFVYRVTFPQTLNLNSFIKNGDASSFSTANGTHTTLSACDTTSSEHGSVESAIKCDDCSTTDSGSILEEDVGTTSSLTGQAKSELDGPDDDEGIDMSSNAEKASLPNDPGPYNYELFSINIHSGSASGGHYYAYIREFENGEWFCFNDQSVTPINQEAIEKSYGGALASRSFYSSAYSSSTNAYMLMYRQVDPQRNQRAMNAEEFPEHITQLQKVLKDESERRCHTGAISESTKFKVHRFDPLTQQLTSQRIFLMPDATLEEALESAHRRFKLQNVIPIERCRFLAYDTAEENVFCSFDGKEKECVQSLLDGLPITCDLLLESCDEGAPFEKYETGSIETKVYTVDVNTSDMNGPILVRVSKEATIGQYKHLLASKLKLKVEDIVIAVLKYNATLPENDNTPLYDESVSSTLLQPFLP